MPSNQTADADGAAGVRENVEPLDVEGALDEYAHAVELLATEPRLSAYRKQYETERDEARSAILAQVAAQARAAEALRAELRVSEAERLEQARLLGASGLTEARLRARLAEAEGERDKAREAMKLWSARAQELAVLAGEHEERAVQAEGRAAAAEHELRRMASHTCRDGDDAWEMRQDAETFLRRLSATAAALEGGEGGDDV